MIHNVHSIIRAQDNLQHAKFQFLHLGALWEGGIYKQPGRQRFWFSVLTPESINLHSVSSLVTNGMCRSCVCLIARYMRRLHWPDAIFQRLSKYPTGNTQTPATWVSTYSMILDISMLIPDLSNLSSLGSWINAEESRCWYHTFLQTASQGQTDIHQRVALGYIHSCYECFVWALFQRA